MDTKRILLWEKRPNECLLVDNLRLGGYIPFMKIFNQWTEAGWSSKVNFVDTENTVLGYDMDAVGCGCDDYPSWFICYGKYGCLADADEAGNIILGDKETGLLSFDGWVFDKKFNEDNGYCKIFKIYHLDGRVAYVHLCSEHNGYYSHGFDFSSDELQFEGDI